MDSLPPHDPAAAPMPDGAPLTAASTSRRRLFGAGFGALVAAASPLAARRVAAGPGDGTSTTTSTGSTGRGDDSTTSQTATTSSTTPRRPTDDDLELLRFAQTAELAARELYDAALESGRLDEEQLTVFRAIREAHESYGQGLAGAIGTTAPGEADAGLVGANRAAFSGSADRALAAAADLEGALAATHRSLLGQLQGIDAAGLIASVAVIEGRHAVVLKTLAGTDDLDELLDTGATPLTPAP